MDAFVEARRAEEGPDADRGDWVPEAEIPRRLPRLAERCEALWALEPNRPGKWES